jgi:hypothetical protein
MNIASCARRMFALVFVFGTRGASLHSWRTDQDSGLSYPLNLYVTNRLRMIIMLRLAELLLS